jgi:hypothetical protein
MLLLVVGTYDINRIHTFKRTLKYTPQMFGLVRSTIDKFEQRYLTPYIMTEVDNLARQLRDDEWTALSRTLRALVPAFIEIYARYETLLFHPLHTPLGLTDCSIAMSGDVLIFTDDLPLAKRMENEGRDVLNLNHLLSI